MSKITTHILDVSLGRPAQGVPVVLEQYQEEGWSEIATKLTNEDGRVADLLADDQQLDPGVYRLVFHTLVYFERMNVTGFYPYVPVVFDLKNANEHYHVPLLLSPFGYSTYRGS